MASVANVSSADPLVVGITQSLTGLRCPVVISGTTALGRLCVCRILACLPLTLVRSEHNTACGNAIEIALRTDTSGPVR
eukprot:3654845-Rhodomonas_salina.1